MTDKNNPLLNPPKLPNNAPALDVVKPEHVMPALKEALATANAEIDAIKSNTDVPTFENTIEALEFSGALLGRVALVFSNIAEANSNDEYRAIEGSFKVELTRYYSAIKPDADLFARIKAVYDQKETLKLDASQLRLLEETYDGFVRSGALLSGAQKEEMRKLNERLSELATQFNQNEVRSEDRFEMVFHDVTELKGVPDRALKNYIENAQNKKLKERMGAGMTEEEARLLAESDPVEYLLKLSPPPLDILNYAEDRDLREKVYRAQFAVAYKDQFDNSPLVMEIVKLRQRVAEIMGYKNYAAYVLDNRMAKNPETVMSFLEQNAANYRPAAEDHLAKVKAFAAQKDGVNDIAPWDYGFYNRQLKEETFNLKLEDLRPYFKLENVLDGLRQHAEKLFDITMKEQPVGKYPVYHQDVQVFEVSDNKTGELIGVFYGDYYARPGAKSGGAWAYKFQGAGLENGQQNLPLVINVCNFDKPTKDVYDSEGNLVQEGQPSLLSFDDVITVFHEFGHGLHTLLAKGNYGSLNGTAVKRDFVELPSQVQENWAKQKDVLQTFAKDYKSGDVMPDELIQKINDMENFGAGYAGLRQSFLALLDMTWHSTDPSKIESVEALEDAIIKKASLFERVAGPMSATFGHIFAGGYAAGYYGYKWAEVLDAQMFDMFLKKGLYDQDSAQKMRKVYESGNNIAPEKLFLDAVGEKPNPEALFKREGIAIQKKNSSKPPEPPAP